MTLDPTRQGKGGFTAVETMVAVFILALMGLLIGNTLMKTTQGLNHRGDRQRAETLAGMVFEQYKSYAAISFDELPSHDQTAVTAREFFNTRDNLGFDDMTITTETHCASDGTNCLVQTLIGTGHGSQAQQLSFSKTYSDASLSDSAQRTSGI